MLDEQLIIDIRQYILSRTGILYFNKIKTTSNDIMVSCPYHKEGQEQKPSCGIKRIDDDKGSIGTLHCFACGVTTNLSNAVKDLLGNLYDENAVESRFHLKDLLEDTDYELKQENVPIFKIPTRTSFVSESVLRAYRTYHPYLASRKITPETAIAYDIGYDSINNHITFPIRDKFKHCIGIGRRSIHQKQYFYPPGMTKPLYGVFELPNIYRHLYCVEGPFNLWSLYQYHKPGVALLGTGTQNQYEALLEMTCEDYVLALDGDDAGRKGILKLGTFLQNNWKMVYVADVLDGKDINDMTENEFRQMTILTFREWQYKYRGYHFMNN